MGAAYHIDHNYVQQPLEFGEIHLFQIGTLHCPKDTVVERHLHHNWFELTILTDGSGTIYTNDTPIKVSKGDIYLSFPAEFHEIVSDDTLHFDFFSFQTDNPAYRDDLERIMQQFADADKRILHNDGIRALVRDAIAQIQMPQTTPYRKEILGAQFLQLLILLIRDFKDIEPGNTPYNATQAQQFCFSLMHYIDTHIYTMKNPGELAEVTNYNYSYLSHLFHSVTSQTLSIYFLKRRLETAAGLLRENDLSITQIAQMLQYSSVYAFSKAFRAYYGISPREYRGKNKVPASKKE
ncbi:MAG: AraC family transcriptional regulator [Clostridia bacterium]|nr:AraC family transcriptional regulator [Clostridia bacterium]